MILAILIIIYSIADNRKQREKETRSTTLTRCDANKAKQVVQKAIDSGILHRLDGKPDVSRVYILEPWHHLNIDDKKILDSVIQCTVTNGISESGTIVVYHDGRTGKELATSNRYGFEME